MLREILIDCYNHRFGTNIMKVNCNECQWLYYCNYINSDKNVK